jgi:inhibitor of cysteine peptidase
MFARTLSLLAVLAFGLAAAAPPLTLTDKDSGQSVTIAAGQTLDIRLPANPTTGYQWTAVAVRSRALVAGGAGTYVAPTPGTLGAGGTEVFSYHGVAPGTAHLAFAYARSWEHVAPARRAAFTVVVR